MRSRAAFTVIELVIVMIIAGLVAAMSIGKFTSALTHSRVNRGIEVVQHDLQASFGLAVRNRVPVRIIFDTTAMQIAVTNRAQTVTYRAVGLGPNSGLGFTRSNVTMYPSTFLEVYPNGFASDTLGITISVTQSGSTYQRHIWMSRAGLLQIK